MNMNNNKIVLLGSAAMLAVQKKNGHSSEAHFTFSSPIYLPKFKKVFFGVVLHFLKHSFDQKLFWTPCTIVIQGVLVRLTDWVFLCSTATA